MIRLYLIWTIIYLPYAVIGFCNDNIGLLKSVIVYVRNVIFVGENYLSWPLWYLLAIIVAGMIYYLVLLLRPKHIVLTLIVLAVILVGIGHLLDSGLIQNGWYLSLFKSTRNGFFQGFPYMTIGFVISAIDYSRNIWLMTILLFVGVLIQLLGYKCGSYVTIYSLFSITLSSDYVILNEDICKKYRLMSTVVYFVHMLWVGIIVLCPIALSSFGLFIVVAILSFATAVIVMKKKDTNIVKILFK